MATNSYDEIRYPSYAYPATSPDNLATLAILSGRTPPRVETSRVLELGCGEGGNLLPLAWTMPDATFVGVDLAQSAIETARRQASLLRLTNVEFLHRDIFDLSAELGSFDTIIVYGVYSWVPPAVRDRMMSLIRELLTPQGVAYISYNVFPGWRQFGTLRDAMIFHARHEATPAGRLARAKEMMDLLAERIPDRSAAYRSFFVDARKALSELSDGYLAHDFLEDINEPSWFRDFVAHAARHGLQFLANAEFAGPETVPPDLESGLGDLAADVVELEQYRDLLTNRSFRQTLLCHQDPPVQRRIDLGCLRDLFIASRVEPVEDGADPSTDQRIEYRSPSGAALSTAHPLTKVALALLAEAAPRAMSYLELFERAASRVGRVLPEDGRLFAQNLILAYTQNVSLVQLHAWSPPVATGVGERPQVIPTARLQARDGIPVTNWFHQRIKMDDLSRVLIAHVDGRHAPEDLVGADPDLDAAAVQEQLKVLAQVGLLVG